ncbi:MAG: hypothetical protein ACTHK0_10510, partial [Ginsengibacter sp.]
IKVLFFEELPYSFRISEQQLFSHVKKLQRKLKVKLVPYMNVPGNESINKEELIRIYDTQINDEICAEIIAHMNAISGERFWGEAKVLHELNNSSIHP